MSDKSHFYLTTTLPYVNADPHIGFALEIVQADIQARYHALKGEEVFFNTGTDEHGLKIYRKALEEGRDPQAYVDEYAAKFRLLKEKLGLYPDLHFIRTTDPHHKSAAQEFWRRCATSGDIYKKNYQIKYCVGCELEKTDSELVDGHCPLHPNLEIELINEENYFFRLSKYQAQLLELYARGQEFVVPTSRLSEIQTFVEGGLEDFSISRLKEKMPWGVPVPDDAEQVMYVWFDALINYISTLGWPETTDAFDLFWGTPKAPNAIQIAGKDNLRQQSAMWQAMLLSAGLPTSKQILIHGFITSGGQKMSKSLGNVINPLAIVDEYGTDALRYYLARHIHPFEDSDFTMEKFKEAYNANLANGLGNLVARVMKMAVDYDAFAGEESASLESPESEKWLVLFEVNRAMDEIWQDIKRLDQRIQEKKPFSLFKTDPAGARREVWVLVQGLLRISHALKSFLPATADIIEKAVAAKAVPPNLFPRKE